MPQQIRRRSQASVNYVANTLTTLLLQRGMVYREIILNLTGEISFDSGLALTDVTPAGVWGVVPTLEILANGNDSIRRLTGQQLLEEQLYWYSAPARPQGFAEVVAKTSEPTSLAFDHSLVLPFWMPKTIRSIDTALDSRLLSALQLNVTWGNPQDVVNTANASFTVAPVLSVHSLESFNPSATQSFNQFRQFQAGINQVAANSQNNQIQLPVGQMYRGILIHAIDSDGHDIPNALTAIRVVSGSTTYYDVDAADVQQWEWIRNGISRLQTGGEIGTYNVNAMGMPVIGSSESAYYNPDAWYWVDFVTDGFMSEAIDTLGFAQFILEVDVNNTDIASLEVIPTQVIPIRKATASQGGSTGAGKKTKS